jgi:hypothetical protein
MDPVLESCKRMILERARTFVQQYGNRHGELIIFIKNDEQIQHFLKIGKKIRRRFKIYSFTWVDSNLTNINFQE